MTKPIRVVVADDHPLLRQGVVLSLIEQGNFTVPAQAGSAMEAIKAVETHLPDIVLLDVSMPGCGIAAARTIAKRFPSVGIVMLTVSEMDEDLISALRAGARGYVLKGVSAKELTDVLIEVARGESYIPPSLGAKVISTLNEGNLSITPASHPLSEREYEILGLLATGKSNREIAVDIKLQEKTVKHYMTLIMSKLHVRNRVEAAMKARDMGL